ncbi:MAG: hypothetical protein KDD41_02230 [Flavobacteriales bacterium]|nr:hypothetical protein [Flavobacteriales bacterium]
MVLTALLCLSVTLMAQQPVNPSFEGPQGAAITPQGWMAYGQASSPDTQPGSWKVSQTASHGYTYMSMVCRGYSIYDSYLHEACEQELQQPLLAGETYDYSIDLAFDPLFQADTIRFDRPAQLRVWGRNELDQKELLWESGAVSHSDWKTYYFKLEPSQRTPFLILEAFYVDLPKYCGNVLIDNMQYYQVSPPGIDQIRQPADTMLVSEKEVRLDLVVPDHIDGRNIKTGQELLFRGNKLTITVWDNRTQDGDVISLFLNSKNILDEYTISKDKLEFEVEVEEDQEYYLTLYAHNLGTIPPNTVAMYISDGERKKFLTLSSDLKKCEAVKVKVEARLADL